MAFDLPDWATETIPVIINVDTPTPPVPGLEAAAGGIGSYSGTDQTYQIVQEWTVTALKIGELKEIILISNDYSHTHFKVTIGAVVFCTDTILPNVIPLVFADLKLAAGAVVKVEAKSTDGTEITANAVITGKEIG